MAAALFSKLITYSSWVGFESTSDMETKEFCGAAWPSKVLKGKRRNP